MDIEDLLTSEEEKQEIKNIIWSVKQQFFNKIKNLPSSIWHKITPYAFSLVGLVISVIIFLDKIKITTDTQTISGLLVACAALLGSFVVLAATLSLLPIQNAMDRLTPSIRKYLHRNVGTQVPFVLIAIFSIILLSISGITVEGLTNKIKVIFALFLLLTSFDLIRLYRRSILFLMEPGNILKLIVKDITNYFSKVSKEAERTIDNLLQDKSENEKTYARASLYQQWKLNSEVEYYINEVTIVCRNSINRVDFNTAEEAIASIINIFWQYMQLMDKNIYLLGNAENLYMTKSSSVSGSIVFLLEKLRSINIQAISSYDENLSIVVIRAYKDIGIILTKVTPISERNTVESIPELSLVIGFMEECAKKSLKAEMDDVALEVGTAIEIITSHTRIHTKNQYFYGKAIECLKFLSIYFYTVKKPAIADVFAKHLVKIALKIIAENHYEKRYIFKNILNQFQLLLTPSMNNTLGVSPSLSIYSIAGNSSLPQLTNFCFDMYFNGLDDSNTENSARFEFHDLQFVLEEIYDHIRTIGQEIVFNDHMILWNIIYYIKDTQKQLILIRNENIDNFILIEKIDKLIEMFIYLPGWLFSDKNKPFFSNIESATDYLTYITILLMDKGNLELSNKAISSLISLFKRTYKYIPDNYNKADILVHLEIIKIYAEKCKNTKDLLTVNNFFENPGVQNISWDAVSVCLENRKGHLQRYLKDPNDHEMGDSSRFLLKSLLSKE